MVFKLKKRGWEIERRFLAKIDPNKFPFNGKKKYLEQGYIKTPLRNSSCRIRLSPEDDGELVIKSGKGIKRWEIVKGIERELACFLLDACLSHRLRKTRYCVDGWEIDFYAAPLNGLVLIEKELSALDEEISMPLWVKEYREVTDLLTNHDLWKLVRYLEMNPKENWQEIIPLLLKKIPRIVITGAPCSGKDTVIKELKREFRGRINFMVEMATAVISEIGIKPPYDLRTLRWLRFQESIYKSQHLFEDNLLFESICDGKEAVVFNRGTVDNIAYFDGERKDFEKFFNTSLDCEYKRYDLVLYLEAAARDVFESNKRNNPARRESYEEVMRLHKRTMRAWERHPNFVFIQRKEKIERKIEAVKKKIEEFIKKFNNCDK